MLHIYLTRLCIKAAMTSENQYIILFESTFACHQNVYTDQDFKVTGGLIVPTNNEWDESKCTLKSQTTVPDF